MKPKYTRRQKIAFAVADCLRAAYRGLRKTTAFPALLSLAWIMACQADKLEMVVLRFP